VEFAIILPLLALLVFGIVELTFALYDKAMITNASREGARVGIVYRIPAVTDSEISSVVNNYLGSHLITFGNKRPPSSEIARLASAVSDAAVSPFMAIDRPPTLDNGSRYSARIGISATARATAQLKRSR